MYLELSASPGDHIDNVIAEAIRIWQLTGWTVRLRHNDYTTVVSRLRSTPEAVHADLAAQRSVRGIPVKDVDL